MFSCSNEYKYNNTQNNMPYYSKGFALIFQQSDFENKIVSKKIDNTKLEISHRFLPRNSLLLITNPTNGKSLEIKVTKKSKFPNFFNILISQKIANELLLDSEFPYIEVNQRIKNKSFIAKKAEIFSEEKNVLEKVPVTKIKIDNISSKDSIKKKNKKIKRKFSILIAEFYSENSARKLKKNLSGNYVKKELLNVKRLGKNRFALTSGPYFSINTLKNDHIELNRYGFENLDIEQHD